MTPSLTRLDGACCRGRSATAISGGGCLFMALAGPEALLMAPLERLAGRYCAYVVVGLRPQDDGRAWRLLARGTGGA